jgi:hypothetical protein
MFYWTQERRTKRLTRSEQGSILALVLAVVFIASMIVVSYLTLTNDRRERAGRTLDQAGVQLGLEENVLEAKRQLATQAKTSGRISLAAVSVPIQIDGSNKTLKMTLNGSADASEDLLQFAPASQSMTILSSNGDPFFGARAMVSSVRVEASAKTNSVSQNRLAGKEVTVTPSIDVRVIPVSQFTLFSLHGSVSVDRAQFEGDAGRIYGAQNVSMAGSGNLVLDYPIVSGGDIQTGSGTLSVRTSAGTEASRPDPISLDDQIAYANPADDSQAAWLAAARTTYDSALINPGTIPVDIALVPSSDQPSASLDIVQTGHQCGLEITVNVDQPDKSGYFPVSAVKGVSAWSLPPRPTVSNPQAKATDQPLHQDLPIVAKESNLKGLRSRIVVALNYAALPEAARALASIYIHAVHNSGAPADVVLLIRGAAELSRDLSIVSPHPIIIAGDFNNGANPTAASLITALDVQAVDSNAGQADFGAAP